MPAANDPTEPMSVVAPEEPERYRGPRERLRFSLARSAGGVVLPALLVAASVVTVLIVVVIAALSPKQTAGIVPSGAVSGASGNGTNGPAATLRASSPGGDGSAKPGGPGGTTPRASGSASTAARSTRTTTPPPATRPPPTGTGQNPAWQPDHAYAAGDRVSYAGRNYQCQQAHTSQIGWEPANTPALWQPLT